MPTVKERILLHLYDFKIHAEDYEVPLAMTQEGIAKSVGIDIRHVVQYTRPHQEAGLVLERTAHIREGRRKRKVYDLTERGKLRAHELRRRWLGEEVRVRDENGVRRATVSEVLRQVEGALSLLDVVRQSVSLGEVDVKRLKVPAPEPFVTVLGEAPPTKGFIGRKVEVKELTSDDPLPRVFVLRGIAGIGKSTLAAKVCEAHRGMRHLFWHRIQRWDSPDTLLGGLAAFLSAVGRPTMKAALEQGAQMAFKILREDMLDLPALLVFDDAHEAGAPVVDFLRAMKEHLAEAELVRILVITRRKLRFYDPRDTRLAGLVQEIDLRLLKPEDIEPTLAAEEDRDLLLDLGRHPLFLRLLRSVPPEKRQRALRDIHEFIREAVYTELSGVERRIMKLASLYRVSVPPEALLPDPAMSYDHLLGLTDGALLTVVQEEALEAHDTIREFFSGVLTEHEQRDLSRFAIGKLAEIADQAGDRGDYPACVRYLSNALELSPMGFQRQAISEALGDALDEVGDVAESEGLYRAALSAAAETESKIRIQRKIANSLIVQGAFPKASAEVEEGFRLLGSRQSLERGRLSLSACRIGFWKDEWEEVKEHGQVALETFHAHEDPEGEGEALLVLAHAEIHSQGGDPRVALNYAEESLAFARSLEDQRLLANVLGEIVYIHAYFLGEPERAAQPLADLEALLAASPDHLKRLSFHTLKGSFNLFFLADFQAAQEAYEEVQALGEKFDNAHVLAAARHGQAMIAFYQGQYGEAFQSLMEYADTALKQERWSAVVEAYCIAAECCLLRSDTRTFKKTASSLQDPTLVVGAEARPVMTKSIRALDRFIEGDAEIALSLLQEAMTDSETSIVRDELPLIYRGAILHVLGRKKESEESILQARERLESASHRAAVALLPSRLDRLTEVLASHNPA